MSNIKSFPQHKTKIICTIGPLSRSPAMLEHLIRAGMNVARLNFSHGEFEEHRENIRNIRAASAKLKRPVSIIADVPGVKMRIGTLRTEPVVLKKGAQLTLTTRDILGTASLISVSYKQLPKSVRRGGIIYMNDGFIQLKIEDIQGTDIFCRVMVGGLLRSHKGLNLPGAHISVNPVTKADLEIIEFCLKEGVNIFGLSFIQKAADILKVKKFVKSLGKQAYMIAKIERPEAVENFEEILKVSDGVMIARGDLGIEVPMEEVPGIQKRLIRQANLAGCPVITATQMLGSMSQHIRPTRAEVTDVANAILDGTDAVMLSEETAIGDFPVETVEMMARIANANEYMYYKGALSDEIRKQTRNKTVDGDLTITDAISLNVVGAARSLKARCIMTQISGGNTTRNISRFKPDCWITAFCHDPKVAEFLNFSYGVLPLMIEAGNKRPEELLNILKQTGLVKKGDTVVVTERRFSQQKGETDSLGITRV